MDNNNFEQQFTRNVQQTATVQPAAGATNSNPSTSALSSKLPWIIVAGLSFVILLQVIALIIVLTNFAPETFDESDEADIDENSVMSSDENYLYDNDENLIAINATCTKDGNSFTFSTDKKYTSPSGSGTYYIINDDIIVLDNNTSHPLYYDSISVIDGTTIYTCEEPDTEGVESTE